jgi:hypothetical protein
VSNEVGLDDAKSSRTGNAKLENGGLPICVVCSRSGIESTELDESRAGQEIWGGGGKEKEQQALKLRIRGQW